MGLLAKYAWNCPADTLVQHYRRHITSNHADIGVGSGYCLDRCGFDTSNPRLVLIDLQPNCLDHAGRRLARYRPRLYLHDALQPMRVVGRRFDSVALGGVLHCLPGDMRQKSSVFDALEPLTAPGSKVFGYTLVTDSTQRRLLSRIARYALNRFGIINNARDRAGDLSKELSRRFVACNVKQVGDMVFFSAIVPHRYLHAGDAK